MKKFKAYLKKRGYLPNTVRSVANQFNKFVEWCSDRGIDHDNATLEDLYDYQSWVRAKGYTISTISERMTSIKHYYRFTRREENPALLVKTEKAEKTIPRGLMDEEGMTEIYMGFMPKTISEKRNKCMLGLVLFQGLRRGELTNIKLSHINNDMTKIYISETRITNERYLPIKAIQRPELENYIYELRKQLLVEGGKDTEYLFFSKGSNNRMNTSISRMLYKVRRNNPSVESLQQLRESRIALWVKQHGIRKTQYMSGIKYASSVLRYKAVDNEKLRQKVALVHPMEKM